VSEWPDGTESGRYQFRHALYQQVLYGRLGSVRRWQLHRRIGRRRETGYGPQAREIAARLAVHFERGGEIPRAVDYWEQTGHNAAQRNAYSEAIAALRKALAWLATLPETPDRLRRQLTLQAVMATATSSCRSRKA
jgi:predicted ATPase